MPNAFAYVMLFVWPVAAIVLFVRLGLRGGLIATLLGGYLILPPKTGLNLPMLPTWEKDLAAALAALLLCLALERGERLAPAWREAGWLPRSRLARLLLLVLVFEPILTVIVNGDRQIFGAVILPPMKPYDFGAVTYAQITMIVPFLLARRYLADAAARKMLLWALVLSALIYTLPMLLELWLSPQLNNWVYGFHSFKFNQSIRDGGYRPVVFVSHGLRTTLFLALAAVAAAGLWRAAQESERLRMMAATGWIGLVLALSHSLGALISAVAFVPLARWFGRRLRLAAAAAVAAAVLVYPMLRGGDLVPTEALVSGAEVLGSVDRAASLAYRFRNEDLLLARANERPFFGWGIWGRNRVYDERGRDISVTDGRWVIVFGSFGWIGYLAEFGLLTAPILLVYARRRRLDPDETTVTLCLILALNLIDLIPNSGQTPITWMVAGATLGAAEARAAARLPPGAAERPHPRRAVIGATSVLVQRAERTERR